MSVAAMECSFALCIWLMPNFKFFSSNSGDAPLFGEERADMQLLHITTD